MSEIKTTAEIRSSYTDGDFWDGSEFDRWLEAHNAEVTAQAEARIIKLLEAEQLHDPDVLECHCGSWREAIALIKGKAE